MSARAANAYRKGDLESAPKHVVLERLFDRFARDLAQARDAIAAGDIQQKATLLDHALSIVGELCAALDHAAAPELCANLDAIYQYVIVRIGEASLKLEIAPLDEAATLMNEIGNAFKAVHPR